MAALFETLRIELSPSGYPQYTRHFRAYRVRVDQGKIPRERWKTSSGPTHELWCDMLYRTDLRKALNGFIKVQVGLVRVGRVESYAKAIVNSACRGESYITEPAWYRVTYLWKMFCPEVIEWTFRLFYLASKGASAKEAPIEKMVNLTGANRVLYPETIHNPEIKTD